MALDESTRSEIAHPSGTDDSFEHLRIECRGKDKNHQHDAFGELLFNTMKSVRDKKLSNCINVCPVYTVIQSDKDYHYNNNHILLCLDLL